MPLPESVTDLSQVIGNNLRCARSRLGLTQVELAARTERLGFRISDHVISKIELGGKIITVYDLFVLSQALHLPADCILRGEYNDENPANRRIVRP